MSFKYNIYGKVSGETLVLLHPGGTLHSIWLPLIRHWSETYHIIAFDIHPIVSGEIIALDRVAQDIIDTLNVLEVQKFHLLGSSLGGNIALHIAYQVPEKVCSLILDSAQQGSASPPLIVSMFINILGLFMMLLPSTVIESFMLRQFKHLTEQDQIAVQAELKQIGKLAFVQHAKANLNHNMSMHLPKIQVPTLILAGKKDMLTKSGEPQKLYRGIANAKLEIIPDVGHVTFLANPDLFLSLSTQFLTEATPKISS